MIKQLSGLPASVIGFEVTGAVTVEDFRDVVLPAVETAARSGDVRFMIVIPEFHGMTPGASGRISRSAWRTSGNGSASPS